MDRSRTPLLRMVTIRWSLTYKRISLESNTQAHMTQSTQRGLLWAKRLFPAFPAQMLNTPHATGMVPDHTC